ncbi:MAG: nucleoside kinase [Muribaculaceae bacterium]|nr:nucleoside kinase [Muribaculaceae bacterium]
MNTPVKINLRDAETVSKLNDAVASGTAAQLIHEAEQNQDNKLDEIAGEIIRRNKLGGASVVMIAGPSSSGKTTTSKRLGEHLKAGGLTPKLISLDDYFVNRADTPRDEKGEYDYESIHALDVPQFKRDMQTLLSGGEINLPTYSFELGERIERERPLSLKTGEVLVVEGIHGLNPELTSGLDPASIFRLYVSALTRQALPDGGLLSTSDQRLLRRLVRDNKYRHTAPESTLKRWDSVRRGEEKWIFPFQGNNDAAFDTSLPFEPGVIKGYASPLLEGVSPGDSGYDTARRLLKLLEPFASLGAEAVPSDSLLREFVGGSSFHY